jgi:hypothetical protein
VSAVAFGEGWKGGVGWVSKGWNKITHPSGWRGSKKTFPSEGFQGLEQNHPSLWLEGIKKNIPLHRRGARLCPP